MTIKKNKANIRHFLKKTHLRGLVYITAYVLLYFLLLGVVFIVTPALFMKMADANMWLIAGAAIMVVALGAFLGGTFFGGLETIFNHIDSEQRRIDTTNTFTLEAVRDTHMFTDNYTALTDSLAKSIGENPPLSTKLTMGDVAISNGRYDALWCISLLPRKRQIATALPTVKRAAKLTASSHSHKCIDDLGKWVAGDKTIDPKNIRDAATAEAAFAFHNPQSRRVTYAYSAVAAITGAAASDGNDFWDSYVTGAFFDTVLAVRDDARADITLGIRHETADGDAVAKEEALQLADIIRINPPIHMKGE